MILGFIESRNGEPTLFMLKILACVREEYRGLFRPKLHTIRRGNRWSAGAKLHLATGVRTKRFHQFAGINCSDWAPGLEYCTGTQNIIIKNIFDDRNAVIVDGRELHPEEILELALNDGFETVDAFWNFFAWEDFEGQIIHWTEKRY